MLIGTNYHPAHGVSALEVSRSRAQIVRYPLWEPYTQWTKNAINLGMQILVVLDSNALRENLTARVKFLLSKHPDTHYWQIGNESDQPNSDSSWYQEPSDLNNMLHEICPLLREAGKYILAPGMVSGNPEYLDNIDLELVDAIAVHPYGQAPNNWGNNWGFGYVGDLLANYRRFRKPIHITEFGGEEALFHDEHERAVYHTDMIRSLADESCESAIQFCYTDRMVPSFGLVDDQGNLKESYAAFRDSIYSGE